MTPEKIEKIIALIKLYGNKNFWEGVYSERGNEKRVTEQANLSDKTLSEITEKLNEEAPQPDTCSRCGNRVTHCICGPVGV